MNTTLRWLFVPMAILLLTHSANGQALWIDFNSLTQDNGPHHHPDYQPYNAAHEVPEDFNTKQYEAFGTTVSFTPTFPDTTDNRVMQAIDRGSQGMLDADGEYTLVDEDGFPIIGGNDFNWFDMDVEASEEVETGNIDVVTDWIGADTRIANGGNGDYDGEVGDPTRMLFTLSGVPAGDYNWVSFHHDTENMWGRYWFDYSVDGGETFAPVGDREFRITKSTTGGNPASDEVYIGIDEDFNPIDLKDLPSTVEFDFTATGDDVVLQFTPLSEGAVHTQFVAVNAFQLTQTGVGTVCTIPDGRIPGDLDGSGDVAFADFLVLSGNFGKTNLSYAQGDIDCDGTVAFADFLSLSGNFGKSAGGAQSVPEPSGLSLACISFGLLSLCRKWNSKRRSHPA